MIRVSRAALIFLLGGGAAFLAAGWLHTSLERRQAPPRLVPAPASVAKAAARVPALDLPRQVDRLKGDITRLQNGLYQLDKKMMRFRPRKDFVVVDTAHNHLWLRRGKKVLRESTCSTGNGKILRDPAGGRSWIFSTPRGEFHVTNRLENPLWRKPDWAFIEDGEPVPTRKDAVERFEEGALGEYALAFGHGYLIHGTLYTRLLGKSVTHGCIRLGPRDLKAVYDHAPLKTKIFIF